MLTTPVRPAAGARRVACHAAATPTPAPVAASAAAPAAPAPSAVPQQPAFAADAATSQPVPEATAMSYPPYDPRVYQGAQQYQGAYQMMPPPGYYPPLPPPSLQKEEASSGAPWWIWLGAGVLVGQILSKVQEFMKNPKTPQQMMAEMAMKQMMGAMGNNGAGASPFGAPGASPFGAPGASPFGAPGASPFPFPPSMPPVDTTATTVNAGAASTSAPSSSPSSPGSKFSSRINNEGREPTKTAASTTTSSGPKLETVEPTSVKEPSSSSTSSSAPKSSFSFADVTVDATASASSSSSGSSGAGAGTGGVGAESGTVMSGMMEQMLRNPEMQKMLYPYLPEPMRNPSSIEWMLNNPEVKKQMEQMFAQQNVMSPQMMDMMKGMDFNQDKVNQQFAELGLKPEDVISKVMANPELASGFSNPKVQAAIIDISSNPMNIMKYQEDPEIMKVLEKVTEIFQPNVAPGARQ